MEKTETNEVIDSLEDLFEKQIVELKKLREQNDAFVWSSDIQAATETGLGRTYFARIRHKLPHIEVKDEVSGVTSVVYPKEAVKQWLAEHTEYYGR
jgi:hypothetical protein